VITKAPCTLRARGSQIKSSHIDSVTGVKTTTPGPWLFVGLFYWCLFTSDFSVQLG